jgi:hypothetical protein
MFDFNINLKLEIKIRKSDIIQLSDINYVQTSAFNKKYYASKNIIQKCF